MNDLQFALLSGHPAWDVLKAHVARNVPEYLTFIAALMIAAVCTMPKKMPLVREDSPIQELWVWFRDSLQTAVPAARARQEAHSQSTITTPTGTLTEVASTSNAPPNPTPPEAPAPTQ